MSLTRTDLPLTVHFRTSTVEPASPVKILVSVTAIIIFEHGTF